MAVSGALGGHWKTRDRRGQVAPEVEPGGPKSSESVAPDAPTVRLEFPLMTRHLATGSPNDHVHQSLARVTESRLQLGYTCIWRAGAGVPAVLLLRPGLWVFNALENLQA